jgi:hypothetical protein
MTAKSRDRPTLHRKRGKVVGKKPGHVLQGAVDCSWLFELLHSVGIVFWMRKVRNFVPSVIKVGSHQLTWWDCSSARFSTKINQLLGLSPLCRRLGPRKVNDRAAILRPYHTEHCLHLLSKRLSAITCCSLYSNPWWKENAFPHGLCWVSSTAAKWLRISRNDTTRRQCEVGYLVA